MRFRVFSILIITLLTLNLCPAFGQETDTRLHFFEPADSFHQKRFNLALSGAAITYTGFSIALYNTWYKQFPRSGFHFFDDWGEWKNMDKLGHVYTAYFQSVLCYKAARWTGLEENQSILVGALCGTLFQSTIEVMDGFSEEWGFSITDFLANGIGVSAFVLQEKYWHEQRILLKVSSWPKDYSSTPIISQDGMVTSSLRERTDDLFGSGYGEQFLKDYNAQTVWASFNISSFAGENSKWPDWLNIGVGFGADNMFGGFENQWATDDRHFQLSSSEYPRYNQYYLAPDIDFTRIKTKSPFLKTLFSVLNIFKFPAPAIEYNSTGEFKFHFLFL